MVLWLAGPVLVTVSIILIVNPSKQDPDDPNKKIRDWPVIIGCFVGGVVAFKLWSKALEMLPIGRASKAKSFFQKML